MGRLNIIHFIARESESRSVMSDSLQPHGLYSPWNSPGQNAGVGSSKRYMHPNVHCTIYNSQDMEAT